MSSHDVLPVAVAYTMLLSSVFVLTVPEVSDVCEHVVPVCSVRNDCKRHPGRCTSEGNGRSKEYKGENKGNRNVHGYISLSVL